MGVRWCMPARCQWLLCGSGVSHSVSFACALQALQAVTELANSTELHLEWDLEPGDIQVSRQCMPAAAMLSSPS